MTPHQPAAGHPLPVAYTERMQAWRARSMLDPYPPNQKGSTYERRHLRP